MVRSNRSGVDCEGEIHRTKFTITERCARVAFRVEEALKRFFTPSSNFAAGPSTTNHNAQPALFNHDEVMQFRRVNLELWSYGREEDGRIFL